MLIALLLLSAMAAAPAAAIAQDAAGHAQAEAQPADQVETAAPDYFDRGAAVAKCRAAAKRLGAGLKRELMAAMSDGGPLAAIGVCHDMAPVIADSITAETGVEVGRTALRLRNPLNAPDAWESAALEDLAARAAGGEKPGDIEIGEVVAEPDGSRSYRWVKGIGTIGLCVKCHGAELEPELAERIAELYPWDKAVGFAPGDLRGAFTVSAPID